MSDPTPTPRNSADSDIDLTMTQMQRSESTIFGGYEILAEVSRDVMGVVYKARQLALDRVVALKLVLSGSDVSESELRRFQVEAKAAARLDHPHIVPVYEIGEHQGQHYFSMGYVDGPSLSVRLAQSGPLPPREAAEILRKVAEAVDYAHRQGVIHRDLKPGNVLLTSSGEPKVTDFGLAKRLEGDQSLTATGQVFGTPAYMSPEQAQGDHEVIGPATDVYSLGATLFAALTGRPPFTSTVIHELLIQVTEELPPSLRTLNVKVPAALEAICLKCLAKSPADRYPSARAMAEDLGRFLGSERVVASEKSAIAKLVLGTAAVAVVLVAVIGGVWFGRDNPVRPSSVGNETPDVKPSPSSVSPTSPTSPQLSAAEAQLLRLLNAAQDTLLPSPAGDIWEFRYSDGAAACEQAFREFGFTLDQGEPSQLAELLQRRSPEFRESVICGLELWELCATAAKQTAVIEPLRQAQDSLDSLAWRKTLRLARGDSDEKIILQVIREALTESPTPEQIEWLSLLIGSRSPEKNPEALGVLRSLLQESPKSFLTNLVTASALHAIARNMFTEGAAYASEAVVPLRAAVKARPTSALSQAQLVAVFTDLGNTEAATTERERLYQRQYPEAWPLVVAARKARESKQYDQAIVLFREALAKQADVPHGEFELAANLILNGQDADAEPLLQKIAQNAVDDRAAYQVLQEVFRIVEQPSSGSGKPSRDLAAKNLLSARVWRAFVKYRRSQGADAPPMAIAPFDAEQAKQHQEEWAKHLGVPVEYTNSIGMKFRLIPPGEFLMGSDDDQVAAGVKIAKEVANLFFMEVHIPRWERPQHSVVLTNPYYFGTTEVTLGQFRKFAAAAEFQTFAERTPDAAKAGTYLKPGHPVTDDMPASYVTWSDTIAFCQWLSGVNEESCRLPTEAEWEYACRAGTTTQYWFGDSYSELEQHAWFNQTSEKATHPIALKTKNPFGLFNVHGNVWEWCEDYADESYKNSPTLDPTGPTSGTNRVLRGGSVFDDACGQRSAFRLGFAPTFHFFNTGFRVTLSVDAVRQALNASGPTKPASASDP